MVDQDLKKQFKEIISKGEVYGIVNLQAQQMIIKRDKKHDDNHKSNTFIPFERITSAEISQAEDNILSVNVHNFKKYELKLSESQEINLWLAMFEYIIAANKVKDSNAFTIS